MGTATAADNAGHYFPWFSPDERTVVFERHAETGLNLWLLELSRGTTSRFTFDQDSHDQYPVWAPDGSSIVYTSEKAGVWSLNRRPSSGTGQDEQLVESTGLISPTDWSLDGSIVLYDKLNRAGDRDVWLLSLTRDQEPEPLLETPFDEGQAQFSPDGKWILYTSNESGRAEIYAQTFPTGGGKWQISTDGGSQPKWRRDGKEVFYIYALGHLLLARAGTLEAIPFDAANLRIEGEPVPIATDLSLAVSSSVNGVVAGIPSGQPQPFNPACLVRP